MAWERPSHVFIVKTKFVWKILARGPHKNRYYQGGSCLDGVIYRFSQDEAISEFLKGRDLLESFMVSTDYTMVFCKHVPGKDLFFSGIERPLFDVLGEYSEEQLKPLLQPL